jgi:NADPH-dependent 2,4-dienoyl-CoA reductase/sulfur reductase-like enzyme
MLRVCVIGGGTAGLEAAREAAFNGASVTVLERSQTQVMPRRDWPRLVEAGWTGAAGGFERFVPAGVDLALGTAVKALAQGAAVTDRLGRVRYDVGIVATGCSALPQSIPGHRKRGVLILDNPHAFAELGRRKESIERAVVCGEGVDALRVAAGISGSGRVVTLLSSDLSRGMGPGNVVNQVLAEAALERGVTVSASRLHKAVGFGELEAVIASGDVIPCDSLAVVPPCFPDLPSVPAPMGRFGGILVDAHLRGAVSSLYAAGECAELLSRLGRSELIPSSASSASGRIAGTNSTGRAKTIAPVKSLSASVFGLKLVRSGSTPDEASAKGFVPNVASKRLGRDSACSIIYDRCSGQVLGVEAISPPWDGSLDGVGFAISSSASIEGMAFGQWDNSSDISVVAETAREGLKSWRGY